MNNNKLQLFIIIISILLIVSCTDNDTNSNKLAAETLETNTQKVPEKKDSVQYQIPFPSNVAILLPTQYRKESGYPKDVKDKIWYEIYKDAKTGNWIIAKADLKIRYERDECVGDDVMIVKSGNKDAVMFFTPFEGLSENPVTVIDDTALFPGRMVTFSFHDKKYTLSPEGTFLDNERHAMAETDVNNLSEIELGDFRIKSYKLSLVSPGNGIFKIASIDLMEYVIPKIIWAGDLNSDGYPDMILELPDFYESQHIFFLMTDPNDTKNPFKKVADLKVVNDC